MAYNKKYAELGESVIDYVNDREDKIEGAFDNLIRVERGLKDTVGGGGALTFSSSVELYNFMLTSITGADVDLLYVAWKIQFQATRDRYAVYLYDRRNGNSIKSGAEVTYTRIFSYR